MFGRSLRERIEVQGSPKPSQQGEAQEFAPLGRRQSEGGRELIKEIGVCGPNARLYRRAAAKKFEPPRVHALRGLRASVATCRLADESLGAVEALSIAFRRQTPAQVALDRS
jgi:hypothetical protein